MSLATTTSLIWLTASLSNFPCTLSSPVLVFNAKTSDTSNSLLDAVRPLSDVATEDAGSREYLRVAFLSGSLAVTEVTNVPTLTFSSMDSDMEG